MNDDTMTTALCFGMSLGGMFVMPDGPSYAQLFAAVLLSLSGFVAGVTVEAKRGRWR